MFPWRAFVAGRVPASHSTFVVPNSSQIGGVAVRCALDLSFSAKVVALHDVTAAEFRKRYAEGDRDVGRLDQVEAEAKELVR